MPWIQDWGFPGSQVLQAHACITQGRFTAPWSFCPASPSSPNPFSKRVWELILPWSHPQPMQVLPHSSVLPLPSLSLLSISNSCRISGKHFKTSRTTLDQYWYLASSSGKLSTDNMNASAPDLQTQSSGRDQLEPAPGTEVLLPARNQSWCFLLGDTSASRTNTSADCWATFSETLKIPDVTESINWFLFSLPISFRVLIQCLPSSLSPI